MNLKYLIEPNEQGNDWNTFSLRLLKKKTKNEHEKTRKKKHFEIFSFKFMSFDAGFGKFSYTLYDYTNICIYRFARCYLILHAFVVCDELCARSIRPFNFMSRNVSLPHENKLLGQRSRVTKTTPFGEHGLVCFCPARNFDTRDWLTYGSMCQTNGTRQRHQTGCTVRLLQLDKPACVNWWPNDDTNGRTHRSLISLSFDFDSNRYQIVNTLSAMCARHRHNHIDNNNFSQQSNNT